MKKLILISTISITSIVSIIAYLLINNEEKIEKEVIEKPQIEEKIVQNKKPEDKNPIVKQTRNERIAKEKEQLAAAQERMSYAKKLKQNAINKRLSEEAKAKKEKEDRIKYLTKNLNWVDKEKGIVKLNRLAKKEEMSQDVINFLNKKKKTKEYINGNGFYNFFIEDLFTCNNLYESVKMNIVKEVSVYDTDNKLHYLKIINYNKKSESILFINEKNLLINLSFGKDSKSNNYYCNLTNGNKFFKYRNKKGESVVIEYFVNYSLPKYQYKD